jgi:gluconate 2-dehydrogenase gamma chain
VPTYIDQQLAGAYGQGARFYAAGPWQQGLPSQGYQLPLNPSQLYRTSLGAIAQELQRRGADFAAMRPDEKDAFLHELEDGKIDLGGYPSSEFFETLLANTIEGFFCDPSYGGNRDMVGWRMIGFPGAYAAYVSLYTSHGMKFEREPMSIASQGAAERMKMGHRHG